jgi:hypothetical protein
MFYLKCLLALVCSVTFLGFGFSARPAQALSVNIGTATTSTGVCPASSTTTLLNINDNQAGDLAAASSGAIVFNQASPTTPVSGAVIAIKASTSSPSSGGGLQQPRLTGAFLILSNFSLSNKNTSSIQCAYINFDTLFSEIGFSPMTNMLVNAGLQGTITDSAVTKSINSSAKMNVLIDNRPEATATDNFIQAAVASIAIAPDTFTSGMINPGETTQRLQGKLLVRTLGSNETLSMPNSACTFVGKVESNLPASKIKEFLRSQKFEEACIKVFRKATYKKNSTFKIPPSSQPPNTQIPGNNLPSNILAPK